jgi:uncharacterized protein
MKNGYRIIDTDTHVGPTADVLYEYGSDALRRRRPELTPYEFQGRDGTGLSISPYPYQRAMGARSEEAAAERGGTPSLKGKTGNNFRGQPQPGVSAKNSAGRLLDMDAEGRDVDVIIPGTFANAISVLDRSLATELHAAYNRYIVDYCAPDPSRLKATILAPGWDPGWAAQEIRRMAAEACVAAVTVVLPEGLPIDDPDLHPIWAAMDESDLPILHHSFFYEPPYFPGYRDVWGHIAVARAAAHPWGAQRLLGYVLLSGLFDQFPNLRIGFAECSAGWLPAWLVRLEGQADYLAATLPVRKRSPLEYTQDGRVFCGVDLYEGPAIVRAIFEVVGDGAIMFQSDYPHDQCYFPESVNEVFGWDIPEASMRKLMSENAERYLRMA